MSKKINILIHGPFVGNGLEFIFEKISKGLFKELPNIIVVSYVEDYGRYKKKINEINKLKLYIKFVVVKDMFNPGFFNINRQIMTVSAGLQEIPDDEIVIKLRNDQWINFKKLNRYLDECKDKIITTNCYTRKDRLYHPSDMFLCGKCTQLKKYYSMNLLQNTHLDYMMNYVDEFSKSNEEMYKSFRCPENMLFINYLKINKWDLKNTFEDSYEAIKKYCYVLNSWDIDLHWVKNRTPLLGENSIILPYTITSIPFPGADVENAKCYNRNDFDGTKSIKDKYYIKLSEFLFNYEFGKTGFCKSNIKNYLLKNKHKIPQWFRNIMKKTFIKKIYINVMFK